MHRPLLAVLLLLAGCTATVEDRTDGGGDGTDGGAGPEAASNTPPGVAATGPCAPAAASDGIVLGAGCTWLHARLRVAQDARLLLEATGTLRDACSHAWMASVAVPREGIVTTFGTQSGRLCTESSGEGKVASVCCLGLAAGERTLLVALSGVDVAELRVTAQSGAFEVLEAAAGTGSEVPLTHDGASTWTGTGEVTQPSWALVQARGLTLGRTWAEAEGQRLESPQPAAFATAPGPWTFGAAAGGGKDAAVWVVLLHGLEPFGA